MKLQHLAIIFVIIMLPISMVITYYIQTQIDTVQLQTLYSSKLQTATHDAIKAFQLNTINNKYSTVSDSKIRDIEASINTFYNSLGTELGSSGYNESSLKDYIPGAVYTMQDGYYIYSKYYNDTISDYQYGLKPYIYYSCRYKNGNDDFVVNYSLDNYISIYGMVNGEYVTKSGPLLDPSLIGNIERNQNGDVISIEYDKVKIEKEILKEQLILIDDLSANKQKVTYEYITYANRRVYKDENGYFWNENNEKRYIHDKATLNFAKKWTIDGHLYSNSAINYYYEGNEFSNWVNNNLGDISQEHAVDSKGNKITDFSVNTGDSKIFKTDSSKLGVLSNNPFMEDSVFNNNRISVIRKSIESNLSVAIANFGAGADYEFVMPVFTEEDWDKLVNNVSVATFMQGIPIGAKYYNNYCIIINNKTKEHVSKESIYVITNDINDNNALSTSNEVHRASSRDVIDNQKTVIGAYKNVDFEMQTVVLAEGEECYYYPHANNKCYECMVNVAETYNVDDIIKGKIQVYDIDTGTYVDSSIDISNLRKVYLTALARERHDLNRIIGDENDYTEGNSNLQKPKIIIDLDITNWTKDPVTATATTSVEGVIIQTSKDRQNWENVAQRTFTENGTIYARIVDAQNNVISEAQREITNIDIIEPEKAVVDLKTADGKKYNSKNETWTDKNIMITAYATDVGSGVSYYQYIFDGNDSVVYTMNNPWEISQNCQYDLRIRAIDFAGNEGQWSEEIKIRRDAIQPGIPEINYEKGSNTDKWQNEFKISLTAEDNGSEIAYYEIDNNNDDNAEGIINPNEYFEPGHGYSNCHVRFRAVNKLGNKSGWTNKVHIHIDKNKPGIPTVDARIGANKYDGTLTKENITINVFALDDLSGIAYYEYCPDINDNFRIKTLQSNPWVIQEDYDGVYYFRAVDGAGNYGDWLKPPVKICRYTQKPEAPTVKYLLGVNECKWQNNIRVKLTTTNHTVAIDHYEVDLNYDDITDRIIPSDGIFVPLNGDDSCSVRFRAVDVQGIESKWTKEYEIHMDTESPELGNEILYEERITSSILGNIKYRVFYIEATDNKSGIKEVKDENGIIRKEIEFIYMSRIALGGNVINYSTVIIKAQYDEVSGLYKTEEISSAQLDNALSIIIRATDKAGNEIIEEYKNFELKEIVPEKPKIEYLYLPELGNAAGFADYAGGIVGIKGNSYVDSSSSPKVNVTIEDTYLKIHYNRKTVGGCYSRAAMSAKKYDLTNYNKLVITFDSTTSNDNVNYTRIHMFVTPTLQTNMTGIATSVQITGPVETQTGVTAELDVSGLTGEYYVGINLTPNANTKRIDIHDMHLE